MVGKGLLSDGIVLAGIIFSAFYGGTLLANEQGEGNENAYDQLDCAQIIAEINQINNFHAIRKSTGVGKLAQGVIVAGAVVASPVAVAAGVAGLGGSKFNKNRKKKSKEARIDELIAVFKKKQCVAPQLSKSESLRRIKHSSIDDEQSNSTITVPPLERLGFPDACANPVDEIKRTYEIGLKDLEPDEYLRFFTVGSKTKNQKLRASHLIYGEVPLVRMVISTRKRKKNRGLWVERLKTGERKQLNYLPGRMSCNLNGVLTVDYLDLWVVVSPQ